MTLSPSPAELSIEQLRSEIAGAVIGPEDAGYDEGRTLLYGGFDRRPAVIVQVADAADVARVIRLARETGLDLSVKAGGHSLAGHSVADRGIVLDLARLKSIDVDPDGQAAWVGGGVTAGELTRALDARGVAVPFGDTGSVGVGGITLGGGVGYLVRKHGMTIDSLLAAEVVTADGEQLLASADSHPDLFWAIRGGGGNFGVVTRFRFRLHPVAQVYGGMLVLPATPEVVAGIIAACEEAPEELSAIVNVMTAPPLPFIPAELVGRTITMVLVAYVGDPALSPDDAAAAGTRALAPLRALATPLTDMVRPMRYLELYPPEVTGFHPIVVAENLLIDRVSLADAAAILAGMSGGGAPRSVQLRVLGGAMGRVAPDATAFAHRTSRIMATVAGFVTPAPDGEAAARQWVQATTAALREDDGGAYVNFVQAEGEESVRAAYPPATLARLAEVKRRYDPDNVFHMNHNIRPAD